MYRLILVMESRIRRNVYVRFGGEYLETYCSNTTTRRILSLLIEAGKPWQTHLQVSDADILTRY